MGNGEILGLCAFRSHTFEGKNIVSPVWAFEYPSQITWADKCPSCSVKLKDSLIYSPGMNCTCGIYATLTASEIYDYMIATEKQGVLFLTEAIGKYVVCYSEKDEDTELPAGGYRAEGIQIQAVVNMSSKMERVITEPQEEMLYTRKKLLLNLAAEKYHVPIIEFDEAVEVAKIMWEKICPDLPWIFNLEQLHNKYIRS